MRQTDIVYVYVTEMETVSFFMTRTECSDLKFDWSIVIHMNELIRTHKSYYNNTKGDKLSSNIVDEVEIRTYILQR